MGQEYKVVFGQRSRADLREVVEYIARASRSNAVAEAFGKALIERALSLKHFPERGRMVPELGRPEIREVIYRSYRVVFRVAGNYVQVVRFWHAARGTPELTIDDFS